MARALSLVWKTVGAAVGTGTLFGTDVGLEATGDGAGGPVGETVETTARVETGMGVTSGAAVDRGAGVAGARVATGMFIGGGKVGVMVGPRVMEGVKVGV